MNGWEELIRYDYIRTYYVSVCSCNTVQTFINKHHLMQEERRGLYKKGGGARETVN